ncbi:surface carbohydrate biosynthesis protein [Flavobacterium sp.]|uniref:surface carbohydrate biosynthesis protein n=1 Tax=Flavobacterium sp. TaxID=239 RepID=UPI002FDB1931
MDSNDVICTWGNYQAAYYKSKLDSSAKDAIRIISTGNPRFEVYDNNWNSIYLDEIDQIKGKYGNYILVNTNLSIANNNFGLSDIFSPRFGYNYDHSESSRLIVKRWNHTNAILGNIVLLIHELAASFPDMSIIVRTHPSESNSFYETVFKGLENVFVLHEGPVAPWILGSEVVIHDGCTTAVESYFANKNVILYKSVENELYDQFVPNLVGTKCTSIEGVIKQTQNLLFTHSKITNERALGLLENFNHNTSFSSLVDVITDVMQNKKHKESKHYNKSFVRFQYFISVLNLKLRSIVRVFLSEKLNTYKAHQKKFYGFNEEFVKHRLTKISKITKNEVDVDLINSKLIILKKSVND